MSAYVLSDQTQKNIDQFMTAVYLNYNAKVGSKFSVEPGVIQALFAQAVLDGAWFLGMINSSVPVLAQEGKKVGMSITGMISGRKNTADGNERKAKQYFGLDEEGYKLYQTNADVALSYEDLDKWRHVSNGAFAKIYGEIVRMAIVHDRLKIGWNGIEAAVDTDPIANPLGQDVNIGWFQKLRNHAPNQIVDTAVTIGAGGTFKNMDEMINEMRLGQAEQFRANPSNRALISSDLIGASSGRYYQASGDTPTEKIHVNDGRILQTYGGLQTLVPPFMPSSAVMITSPKNLSIYHQEGTWRRQILDEPKLDQVSDYNSVNEGFVVEENTAAMVFTNVSFVE
jgi:P2 family phage major capsid protein